MPFELECNANGNNIGAVPWKNNEAIVLYGDCFIIDFNLNIPQNPVP